MGQKRKKRGKKKKKKADLSVQQPLDEDMSSLGLEFLFLEDAVSLNESALGQPGTFRKREFFKESKDFGGELNLVRKILDKIQKVSGDFSSFGKNNFKLISFLKYLVKVGVLKDQNNGDLVSELDKMDENALILIIQKIRDEVFMRSSDLSGRTSSLQEVQNFRDFWNEMIRNAIEMKKLQSDKKEKQFREGKSDMQKKLESLYYKDLRVIHRWYTLYLRERGDSSPV